MCSAMAYFPPQEVYLCRFLKGRYRDVNEVTLKTCTFRPSSDLHGHLERRSMISSEASKMNMKMCRYRKHARIGIRNIWHRQEGVRPSQPPCNQGARLLPYDM